MFRMSVFLLACLLSSCSETDGNDATVTQSTPLIASADNNGAAPIKVISASAPQPKQLRTEIPLEEAGGTFVVPVTINDTISLKFTIDSGASYVTIPSDVASTLVRAGTITKADYVGSDIFVLADGSEVPSPEFRMKSLRVGKLVLHDVVASITSSRGSLLLGQTFLSRLRNWSIDNNRHVLILEADDQAPPSPSQTGTDTIAATTPTDRPSSASSSDIAAERTVRQFFA